jgi:hypothetical protein
MPETRSTQGLIEAAPITRTLAQERRRRRSTDPLVALHYQLSEAKNGGEHEVMVLAETSGLVVAGAGSWPACEELAAFAPLLHEDAMSGTLSPRLESLRDDALVVPLTVDGQDMFLCARGGRDREASVRRAAEGVERILTTRA